MDLSRRYIQLICLFLLGVTTLSAHPSWGIVVDQNNNIYFADIGHNGRGSVWKLYPCGEIELLLRDFHAHNVSLDKEENLITAHGEGDHVMVKLNEDGDVDTLFETQDFNTFFGGNCTFTSNGEILFSIDHYIWRLLNNGQKEKISTHYFEWNQAVFSDSNGNVYAPDKAKQNGSLIKIDPQGKATVLATNLLAKLDRPRDKHNDVLLGMGIDNSGSIYICENAGQRILKITEGQSTEVFYTSSEAWFPTGIYFHNKEAYILEYKYGRNGMEGPQVVKLDQSSKKTVLFNYERDID